MSEIMLAKVLLMFALRVVRRMPRLHSRKVMMVPTQGVCQLLWTSANIPGKTPSRAIEKLSRLEGSRVVWVVARLELRIATAIRKLIGAGASRVAKYTRALAPWLLI